jgi:hypothetical protein
VAASASGAPALAGGAAVGLAIYATLIRAMGIVTWSQLRAVAGGRHPKGGAA